MSGLTSRQQWTLQHITRCSCGSWVVLTDTETRRRQIQGQPELCAHTTPHHGKEAA